MSVFEAYFHAHHLCTSMIAFAVTPHSDTIPILRINNWNFNWQMRYKFKKYLKIPENSIIHFIATYDNTLNNKQNTQIPPKDVMASFNADDEMMELFLLYLDYNPNDENILIREYNE